MYGVLENFILGKAAAEPNMIFFKDPPIFPYYPSKCQYNKFILLIISISINKAVGMGCFFYSIMNISLMHFVNIIVWCCMNA